MKTKFRALIALMSIFLLLLTVFPKIFGLGGAQQIVRAATKEELQQQLAQIEKEIAQYQSQLAQTQSQKNTLANKIKQLQIQQAALNAQIKQTNIFISQLSDQITETQSSIQKNQSKEDVVKAQISQTIRELYQNDNRGLVYAFATNQGLTGLMEDIDHTQQLSKSLSANMNALKTIQNELQAQNDKLEGQQDDAKNLVSLKTLQEQDLNSTLSDQNNLLVQTKGKEAQYQATIAESQRKASEIRNQIYQLAGGSTDKVTFGQAVAYAQQASQLTGVRAAFLLGILTQETNLGQNVGTCNRAGDPPSKSWRVVMKPTRDQEPFKTITAELGLDIDTTPISCPLKNRDGSFNGWGGGMGPAQFIPSTWMGYKDSVAAITGQAANPWNIRDAFVAAAIKLKADGALDPDNGEWKAAMRYFSGGTNLRYRFYGDNVIALTNRYQNDINTLNGQ